jgi:hypothetical protein
MVKDVHQIELEDEDRLAHLGYKQELQREWSVVHNFGVSFSIIVSQCLFCSMNYELGLSSNPRESRSTDCSLNRALSLVSSPFSGKFSTISWSELRLIALQLWLEHWWTRCDDHWMDRWWVYSLDDHVCLCLHS